MKHSQNRRRRVFGGLLVDDGRVTSMDECRVERHLEARGDETMPGSTEIAGLVADEPGEHREQAPRIDRALWPLLILWILFAITMLAFYASTPGIETGAPMMPHR